MSNAYNNIGYIGWTSDAAVLAAAVKGAKHLEREQYVLCPDGDLPELPEYVTQVSAQELASLCRTLILTEGSDPAALDALAAMIAPGVACGDFSGVLPTEKYARARKWEAAGGLYADVAFVGSVTESMQQPGGRFFYSGRGSHLIYRSFYRLLFPIYVPGEAGEATLLRLMRTTPASTLSELIAYTDYYHKTCPAPEKPALIPDVPENEGVVNVVRRARQMTEVLWQPLKKFPKVYGIYETDDFSPEFPVVGLPYSSTRMVEQFIGPNLSFETFFTALENEDSVLYTRDLRAHGNAGAYYGTVCSVFVGNAINLYTRVPCKLWPTIPGMHLVEPNDVQSLKLGDTLLSIGHVAIVTGIDRTEDGKIYQVEVSESTHPVCLRRMWRADVFSEYWLKASGFRIFRYDGVNVAPYVPCAYMPLEDEKDLVIDHNPDLALNFGNKANCRLGETLEISVKSEGGKTLRIEKNEVLFEEKLLSGKPETVLYKPEECGLYSVCIVGENGEISKSVEFGIVACSVSADKAVYQPGEAIIATGHDNSGGKPECAFLVFDGVINNHVRETQHIQWFTPEEMEAGKGAVYFDVPGPYMLKLFFRNKYGVYGTDYVNLEIKAAE